LDNNVFDIADARYNHEVSFVTFDLWFYSLPRWRSGRTDTRRLLIAHKHIQCTFDYPFSDYPVCGLSVHDFSCEWLMTNVGKNVTWCPTLEQNPQYEQLHTTQW